MVPAGKCWSCRKEGKSVPEGPIDMSLLGAYVDGELDVEESARIAEAVANDAEVARQVMVLSRLKSALSGSVEEISIPLPETPSGRRWGYGIAAGLAGVVIAAATLWFALLGGPELPGGADFALNAHQSWSAAQAGDAVDPKLVFAAAPEGLAKAYVPDLASAKLRLVHVSILQTKAGPALLAGYTGSRGCRVTLLVTAAGADSPRSLELKESAGVTRASWRAGALEYTIMAKGMARQRFRLLAASVYDASLEAVPIDRQTQVALARSRAQSKPCLTA